MQVMPVVLLSVFGFGTLPGTTFISEVMHDDDVPEPCRADKQEKHSSEMAG
jgi:hypothetical protein